MASETTGSSSLEEDDEMDPRAGTLWWPAKYAISEKLRCKKAFDRHIVIVLNVPLTDRKYVRSLLSSATYIVCADGGAKRLYDLFNDTPRCSPSTYAPDAICGDFDSLPPYIEEFYRQQDWTDFVKDTDQYSTDFMKCLKYVAGKAKASLLGALESIGEFDASEYGLDIVVIGGLGGRADQAFSQVHHLFAANELESPYVGKTYLITSNSIMFLLEEGCNLIRTPVGPGLLAESVGIIPIGRPSVITTQGLEWDVTEWPTEFGGQISTSNHIKKEVVHVTTSNRVLFTVELAKRDEDDACDVKEEKTGA